MRGDSYAQKEAQSSLTPLDNHWGSTTGARNQFTPIQGHVRERIFLTAKSCVFRCQRYQHSSQTRHQGTRKALTEKAAFVILEQDGARHRDRVGSANLELYKRTDCWTQLTQLSLHNSHLPQSTTHTFFLKALKRQPILC